MNHAHCLSAEPHEENIKEVLLHFLGCLPFSERHDFLYGEHPVWTFEAKHNQGGVTQKRDKWRESCLNELRRIEFLREKLKDDKDESQLVSDLDTSREEWRKSTEYDRGMELVKQWKQSIPQYTQAYKPSDIKVTVRLEEIGADYKPERDVNVPIIKFKGGEAQDFDSTNDGKMVWGKFPDQKTTVEHLLERKGEENILYREKADLSTIKYFHLPSNNMTWAEEAVARYFNEDRPEFYKIQRKIGTEQKTDSAKILKESHWRGQLHGSRQSVNSRFMRPFCEALSTNPTEKDNLPKDIVLFMPYLHWETSRNRERFAQKIEQIVDDHQNKAAIAEFDAKKRRIEARQLLHPKKPRNSDEASKKSKLRQNLGKLANCFTGSDSEPEDDRETSELDAPAGRKPVAAMGRILTLGTLSQRLGFPKIPVKVDNVTGRLQITYTDEKGKRKGSPLGQYLIDAARMFEAITNYRDKRLLEKFLMKESPLHPRRTLDQAYYWTLNTTRSRDKDQVVYRATTAKGAEYHKYDFKTASWPKHKDLNIKGSCRDCTDKIKKVSRVVMVDQLWMWILDANTIITCFPKRYGANKHDSSGVHKSVRTRIGDKRHQQVKSVFDLALIIFEECSSTFFDRTKTSDKQPQVLDAFSEAIGNIMHKQTLAFGRLWRWTEEARKIYKSRARTAGSKLHVPLLDITPEGDLEKEIKDILEELGIMIYVNKTHRDVLKQFINHVKHILDPHSTNAGKAGRPEASRRRLGLSRMTSSTSVSLNTMVKDGNKPEVKTDMPEADEEKSTFDWFNINADETLTRVNDRIEQLEELQRSAEITASSVKDLLELKQQQAGVVQAWQSVRQSDEANTQGQAIMVFTIVTIVFLPLSFMSSLFGMNTKEFGGDDNVMHLGDQFSYIIGISAPVIFLTLVFSLNNWTRSALACIFRYSFLWLCARGRLYQYYLDVNLPSHDFHQATMSATEELLEKQMKLYSQRKWDKFQAEEKEKEKAKKKADKEEAEKGKKQADALARASSSGSAARDSRAGGSLHSNNAKTAAVTHSDSGSQTAASRSSRRSPDVDLEAGMPVSPNGHIGG